MLLELTRRYSEPHRHYHNLNHIAFMLLKGKVFPLSDEQVMAVWYHDAIYDPRSKTNEADSAALAREHLQQLGWSPERIECVCTIVLDTVRHMPSRPESEAVLDLDLAILGAAPGGYQQYVDQIRQEYAFVDDDAWRAGRAEILRSLLERDRLYYTGWGAALESTARENLQRELQTLG
jgi:predicted metal-dependent HD superfamily phosphohydrolase